MGVNQINTSVKLVIIFIISWFSSLQAQQWVRYYDNYEKFSISFPSQWELEDHYSNINVMALSSLEGGGDSFRENVNVVTEQLNKIMEVGEYVTANLIQMKKYFTDFRQVESGGLSFGKLKTKWLVYTYRLGILHMKVLAYFFTVANKGFVITCSSTIGSFDRYRPIFEKSGMSFQLD